jgi:SAM-dependent methyltransferase
LKRFAAPHLTNAAKVLEIGASALSIRYYPHADTLGGARYTVIDTRAMRHHKLLRSPHRFLRRDITHSDLPDDCYDLVLCNNTLPYIREDRRALEEIRRILKPAGLAMLNTHWQQGRTLTACEHQRRHPGLARDFYAENGDQWVYGDDFQLRIREAGFELRTFAPFAGQDNAYLARNGLKADAMLVIGWKQRATTKHPLLAGILTTLPLSPGG